MSDDMIGLLVAFLLTPFAVYLIYRHEKAKHNRLCENAERRYRREEKGSSAFWKF